MNHNKRNKRKTTGNDILALLPQGIVNKQRSENTKLKYLIKYFRKNTLTKTTYLNNKLTSDNAASTFIK